MSNMLAFGKLAFGVYSLASGKTVVVPPRANANLRVHDGVVWATSSGDLDDVWLIAGQEHALADKGRTVIESTERATIELIEVPSRSGWPFALLGVPSHSALRYSRSGRPFALLRVLSRSALRYSRSGRPFALMPAAANDGLADQPPLHWPHIPAWLDGAGTLIALAATVAVMATAAAQVVL